MSNIKFSQEEVKKDDINNIIYMRASHYKAQSHNAFLVDASISLYHNVRLSKSLNILCAAEKECLLSKYQ